MRSGLVIRNLLDIIPTFSLLLNQEECVYLRQSALFDLTVLNQYCMDKRLNPLTLRISCLEYFPFAFGKILLRFHMRVKSPKILWILLRMRLHLFGCSAFPKPPYKRAFLLRYGNGQ